MKGKRLVGIIGALIAAVTVLAGCEALPSPSSGAPAPAGKLQVSITDAPPKETVEEVWLTVTGVKIHLAGHEAVAQEEQEQEQGNQNNQNQNQNQPEVDDGWLKLTMVGDSRFNLLAYQGGLQAKLAVGDLDPGRYTQIRMEVSKVEVKVAGDTVLKDAKLPSNTLKFVHPFEIISGQDTEILFDFDALKSINVQGNGQYMCKPVVKLITTKGPKATGGMEIAPSSLPNGGVGVAYDPTTLVATGGTGPYLWSITTGAIPTGLVFDTTLARLSGTPTAAGDFTFTVKAEDSSSPVKKSATKSYTVNIAPLGTLQVTTTTLPDGTEDSPYPSGVSLKAIGGIGAYTWSVTAGSLPSGLSLDGATGAISGTPTEDGDFSFTVQVRDSAGPPANTDTQVVTISIN